MPLNDGQTTSLKGASLPLPVKLEPGDPPLFEPPLPGPCPTPLPPSAAIGLPASISTVKLEPDSTPLHPSSEASQSKTSAQPSLPTPVEAKVNVDPESDANRPALAHETDKVPNTVDVVIYTPENALAKVLQMADTIGSRLLQVDLGSPLRKDVWLREVESLKSQDLPGTMIAVCGATGAGKSSLLNAVLDDNIVPTSGMRACTAVVTEIRYHNKTTIAAEIEFLALSEWKAELESLLDDLVDKDGKLRRLADLRSDAGVAWHKANFQTNIHAVYPLLAAERMVEMTPDAIIAAHPDIQCILDSTRKIESPNSEAFALEIAQYVDSVDQKRSRDKGKEKSKAGNPALWPLIRLVRVCCGAGALKCGAVLVDLPGIADANLARSSIAKEYMKKCDRIWIVAPITRAVDDKAAKDLLGEAFKTQLINGNYDDRTITFIATKTDDVSCTEMIQTLGLYEDPKLLEIESTLEEASAGIKELVIVQECATREVKVTEDELDKLRAILLDAQQQLVAFEASEPFQLFLTAHNSLEASGHKKRKRSGGGCKPKRQRSCGGEDMVINDHEDELNVEHDVIVISSDNDEAMVLSDSDDYLSEGESMPKLNSLLLMQQNLKKTIESNMADIYTLQERQGAQQKAYRGAVEKLADCRKSLNMAEREKSAFCSKKRNEYSRDALKEDFRQGLKQLNQVEIDGEAKDLNSFDPSKDLRDNNTIDLPVFTCSSRDYIRIKEQVKGDGGPSCFANPEDTGIPALQQWCHELTVTTREQCARSLLNNLTTFLHSIRAHLDDMKGVSVADRTALAEMWKSSMLPSKFGDLGLTQVHPAVLASSPAAPCSPTNSRRACKRSESPSPDSSLSGIARQIEQLQDQKHMMLVGDEGKGISFRLRTSMEKVVSDCVAQLKQAFHDGIDGQCRVGAEKAKKAAVETSDTLADSMHWGTYRATLRRHGEYKRDLNAELVAPMTREIASSWTQVFESDLFTPVKSAARTEVVKLLKEIEDSAPAGLKDRCRAQAQVTLKEVQVVTANILRNIKTAMTNEQKEVSRCLTPHVKSELLDGYRLALEERGAGSVARQKEVFHDYVERNREDIFDDGANSLVDKLNQAAESVGKLLECALNELSEKVEVGMSTLWEIPKGNEDNIIKNGQLMKHICAMLEQLEPWVTASKNAMNIDIEMDTGDGVEDETDVGMDAIEKSGQPDN